MSRPRNPKQKKTICSPDQSANAMQDLKTLVDKYRSENLKNYRAHLQWYRDLKTSDAAEKELRESIIWKFKDGCHGHQGRVSRKAKEDAAESLSLPPQPCDNFHCLFEAVHGMIGNIHGIGEMAVYDAANRLRIMYGLPEPEYIYLHRGTRIGAKVLGLDYRKNFLRRDELPPKVKAAFKGLKGDEIEDFLCVYKGSFAQLL